MGEIFTFVIFGLIGVVLILVLKQHGRHEIATVLGIAISALIFIPMVGKLNNILTVFKDFASKSNVSLVYLGTLMKIIGIAYIADFGAQICRDAGEGAIASKIEFAAKILVMLLALPIMIAILDLLNKLLP